ncbi:MAG: hypothetical protein WAL41_05875, partial [Mycobacterium sp.]
MTTIDSSIEVDASRDIVLRFAKQPALLAEWNNEYIECGAAETQGEEVIFRCKTRRGDAATWTLAVSERVHGPITHVAATIEEDTGVTLEVIERVHGSITHVAATIEEDTSVRYPLRWLRTERQRRKRLEQSLARLKGFAEADAPDDAAPDDAAARRGGHGRKPGDLQPGDKVALLNVYTGQFASYTTLLWQVPALGLTAQAFLMTIVLGGGSPSVSPAARFTASVLSIVIALASTRLMHDQRARAINHAELAKRLSYRLSLTNLVGSSFSLDDAVPDKGTDTQNVWAVNHWIYHIWAGCMYLFGVADLVVIYALLAGTMG